MRTLLRDVRYAIRVLRGRPGFAAVSVITLALGIAASTTVFGWIDALLLRPFPGVSATDRLATIETVSPTGEFSTTSYRDYRDYRDTLRLASGVAASLLNPFNVGPDNNPQRIWGEFVSGNYFDVLGVAPVKGRSFLPSESGDVPGAAPVAMIGYRLWQTIFHADPRILGRTIRLNRHELTIVGVAPPDFCGTVPGLVLELWVPLSMAPELTGQGELILTSRTERQMWITARLRPGVYIRQLNAEVAACARRHAELDRATEGFSAVALPVSEGHIGAHGLLRAPLQILMAACLILFLVAAANVTNLQLAHATARQNEFSMRRALGAASSRIVRKLLTESLLLAVAGAAVGAMFALWLEPSLALLFPPANLPFDLHANLSVKVLIFTALLCAAATVVTGFAPALFCMRTDLMRTLRQDGRGASPGAGLKSMRSGLVICEVSLAFIAIFAMGLFIRSFHNARTAHLGFDPRNVLLAQFYVETFCRTANERTQFCLRLHDRLAANPAISAIAYSDTIPLALGALPTSVVDVEGYVPAPSEGMRVARNVVAPGFFDVLRIPILEGRDFSRMDDTNAQPVAIINQTFARRFLGGRTPIGHKFRAHGRLFTIVGLVRDATYGLPNERPMPHAYMAFLQMHGGEFWVAFFIRTAGPAEPQMAFVRREAAAVDPNAAVADLALYDRYIGISVYPQKIAAILLGVLASMALLLAALGLYVVMAYNVVQRTAEIGIRMALGADSHDVVSMIAGNGMILAIWGISVGLALTMACIPFVSALPFNVNAADPAIFAAAASLLAIVAFLGAWLPARRASRIDPILALRQR